MDLSGVFVFWYLMDADVDTDKHLKDILFYLSKPCRGTNEDPRVLLSKEDCFHSSSSVWRVEEVCF